MTITLQQLEALRAAVWSGKRVVQWDGRKIEYQDLGEMRRALAEAERLYQEQQGGAAAVPSQSFVSFARD
jgi:hypothetical protein